MANVKCYASRRRLLKAQSAIVLCLLLVDQVQGALNASDHLDNASIADIPDDPIAIKLEYFAQPDPSVTSRALVTDGAPSRSLAVIGTSTDWQWPAFSTLQFVTQRAGSAETVRTVADDTVTVCASLIYNQIQIETTGDTWGPGHSSPIVKLVSINADRTSCRNSFLDAPVGMSQRESPGVPAQYGAMGKTQGPQGLVVAGSIMSASVNIVFMMGGVFKLCYKPSGQFGANDGTDIQSNIVATQIQVLGIASGDCSSDGCLDSQRWECSFGYKGESVINCNFDFSIDSGRSGWSIQIGSTPIAQKSRITWTPAYGDDVTDANGQNAVSSPKYCSASPPETDKFIVGSSPYMDIDRQNAATMPPVKPTISRAFTVAACYCPDFNLETGTYCSVADQTKCCDNYQEFIQAVGLVYFWTIRICDFATYTTCNMNSGENPPTSYRQMRVIPHQKFVLRIDCPPGGGCTVENSNRVKFITLSGNNDRPTWDMYTGCRTQPSEANEAVWPEPTNTLSLDGGTRLDYKAWNNKQVKFALSLSKALDVCFAIENSESPASWFKVGRVQTTSAFALSSKSNGTTPFNSLYYAGYPGTITFLGGIMTAGTVVNPFDGNRYSGKALINIMSFDRELLFGVGRNLQTLEAYYDYNNFMSLSFQDEMDALCQRETYSTTLLVGPTSKQEAKKYMAVVDTASENTVSSFYTFRGPAKSNSMTVNLAGVIAICYCGIVNQQDECDASGHWVFATRMTISGPSGDQVYIFPTQIVVMFQLTGWGFGPNDRLRIIPAASTCTSNNNNPASSTGFKVGCPAVDGLGCKQATLSTTINAFVASSSNTGIFLRNASVSPRQTVLQFTASTANTLSEGDIITLDPSRVTVNGISTTDTTISPRAQLEANRFSGIYQFQDDVTRTYIVGHRVSAIQSGTTTDRTRLGIPIGWTPSGSFNFSSAPFAFVDNQGGWTRRNKEQTAAEIKATTAAQNLQLCWGVHQGGASLFYQRAGLVTFLQPPSMASAVVSLTTTQKDAQAPVIIAFSTAANRDEYSKSTGNTMLMIRFLDTSAKIEPLYYSQVGNARGIYPIPSSEEVQPQNAAQVVCGRLFSELWSSHSQGFPMPVGCYYSKKLSDTPNPGESPLFFREIYIVFGEQNGIRQGTDYQLVLTVTLKDFAARDNIVDIYTMCGNTGCSRPYQVFEKGSAIASNSTSIKAGGADPQFGQGGFMIQRGDPITQVLSLSELNLFQVQLAGGSGLTGIVAQSIIRVYMWPLTSWDIGASTCSASCVPYWFGTKVCQGAVGCAPQEVVAGSGRRNIIRLTLPSNMDTIMDSVTHTIKVVSLRLPLDGFFPTRVGAQLTRPEDTAPFYTLSTGFIMKNPAANRTSGRLVLTDRSGYGPQPFASGKARGIPSNSLLMRLQLGATVWNVGRDNTAFIEVGLPVGYGACTIIGTGAPSRDLSIFGLTTNGYIQNNRGVLAVSPIDGDWSNSATGTGIRATCTYGLKPRQAIYAGMVFYVQIVVRNPGDSLPKNEPSNVWTIKLSGLGHYDMGSSPAPYDMPLVNFISLQEEITLGTQYWAGNAAVIDLLAQELVQPSNLIRSCCGATFSVRRLQEELRVFLMTSVYVGQNGFVVFDAPSGFDFGQNCTPSNLDKNYYAFVGAGEFQLNRFNNLGTCTGFKYPWTMPTFNRARFQVGGVIDLGFYYGFQISVVHPTTYDISQHSNWFLWLQDSNGYPLQGSYSSIKFNVNSPVTDPVFYDRSWGMYDNYFNGMEVNLVSNRPVAVTRLNTQVIFYPIIFPVTMTTSMRIIAPYGFTWNTDVNSFIKRSNGTIEDFPPPEFKYSNQLVWPLLKQFPAGTYGFQASVSVPSYNPVVSSNSFTIEIGFLGTDISSRRSAAVYECPTIATITNAQVDFATQFVGYQDNRIQFTFQTVTPCESGDGLVIKGDPKTTGFFFSCPITILPDSEPMPTDLQCIFLIASDSTPQLTLKVTNTPLKPGFYSFEVKAQNPGSVKLEQGSWTFGTYQQVDQYPTAVVLDKAIAAPGFTIDDAILDSRLLVIRKENRIATNRNDRPGQPNQLIFAFQLRKVPQTDLVMALKAPRGFKFYEDCLPGLIVDSANIFGPNTLEIFPPEFTLWPPLFVPTRCNGGGRVARIYIPTGLGRRYTYAFRIAVQSNPVTTPAWNRWSISYNGETSDPFAGFPIWTNLNTNVVPTSTAKSLTGAGVTPVVVPVTFVFTPYNTVPQTPTQPRGGLLRLVAPAGFRFEQDDQSNCEVNLFISDGSVVFSSRDLICEVQNDLNLNIYMIGTKSILGSLSYTMIVRVYHPPTTTLPDSWRMMTFSDPGADPSTALDDTTVLGYPVNNVLNAFAVVNTEGILDGNTRVFDVDVLLNFPDPIKDGDRISITGPKGYALVGNPEIGNCDTFRWVGAVVALPTTGEPSCSCLNNFCTILWIVLENQDPALAQNQDIHFKVSTRNPVTTPFVTDNFWKAVHLRGTVIRSSQIQEGWRIKPQLSAVNVKLVGASLAAGKDCDLEFSFTPVNNADTIQIEAVFPNGFSFDRATVALPYINSPSSSGTTIIINRGGFIAGTAVKLRINSVKLGLVGGQTIWNIQTFTDDTMTTKRDEKMSFAGGFRLPGLITVTGQPLLKSKYQNSPALYPVQSLFPPRIGEEAQAQFILSFTMPVQASQMLIVTCQGQGAYTLKSTPFVVIGTGQIETSAVLDSKGAIQATLKPGRPATEVAFQANTPYTIIFWVFPVLGINTWRFDTSDGGPLPTNTNDGVQNGFSPVMQMTVSFQAVRSPPQAIIDITLTIKLGTTVIQELTVIAPPGFSFDSRSGGCGDMCTPGEPLGSTGRRTATIASPTGEPLMRSSYRIRVLTAKLTPGSTSWFVQGQGQGAGSITGWGEGTGFLVSQMAGSSVSYPAVAGIKSAQIMFTFAIDVDAGNQIQVIAPNGYMLTCSADGALRQLSLPGGRPDCIDDPLQLRLDTTLTTGSYSFGLALDLPFETPADNSFSIVILDQDNNVVDAAYGVQGDAITSIGAGNPVLAWSSSSPGQRTQVTIGLSFSADTQGVKAVLITMPDTFLQDVQNPTDIINMNRRFPVQSGTSWAVTSFKDRLKIIVDNSRGGAIIPAGTYMWTFPALVPPSLPTINYWSITLCWDSYCTLATDRYVIVTFPLAGFQLYELSQAVFVITNASPRPLHFDVCILVLGLLSIVFTT